MKKLILILTFFTLGISTVNAIEQVVFIDDGKEVIQTLNQEEPTIKEIEAIIAESNNRAKRISVYGLRNKAPVFNNISDALDYYGKFSDHSTGMYIDYSELLKNTDCSSQIFVLGYVIEKIDTYLYSKSDIDLVREKLYEKLVLKEDFFNGILGEEYTEYLLRYYNNELVSDYIYGCSGDFEKTPIYTEGGHLLLEGYLVKEYQEEYIDGPCIMECSEILPSYKYKFVLTEDIEDENYLKHVEYRNNSNNYELPNKQGDKIDLGCEIDNGLGSLWNLSSPLENLYYSKVYEIDSGIMDKMKNSTKESPIVIYGTYGMNLGPNTGNSSGNFCWGQFKYIEMVK